MVLVTLQQRLLSSVPALYTTLRAHQRNVADDDRAARAQTTLDDTTWGADETANERAILDNVTEESAALGPPEPHAADLLNTLIERAAKLRHTPDAKQRAFLAWLRAHACPELGTKHAGRAKWTDTRVIVFTEHAVTLRHLQNWLLALCEPTEHGEDRVLVFEGGMDDDARAYVQAAFNAPPADQPVRILLATDAAREGINLQAACADLFHWDLPWNPARIEQRNGRIDRTLQPAPEVRCHYFTYADRVEDRVLDTVIRKMDTIRRELGSVGTVVLDRIEATLGRGIDEHTLSAI